MDRFETNIIELYRKEALGSEEKSLSGYRFDPMFTLIPPELRQLSQGLWHPLRHEAFPEERPLNILDAGCGGGFDLYYLNLKYQHHHYWGADLSHDLLHKGRIALQKYGFQPSLVRANIKDLPFINGFFDAVYSHAVVHLARDRLQVLRELFRVVKDGGTVLICDPIVSGKIPKFFQEEYERSGGIFLYGGLAGMENYQRWGEEAGFSYFDLVESVPFKPHKTIGELLKRRYKKQMISPQELEAIEFSIATFALVKGDKWGKRRVSCPRCSKVTIINYCTVVNLGYEPELEDMLMTRRLNFGQCRGCGGKLDCPFPFFYISRDGLVISKRPERFLAIPGGERTDYSSLLPGMKVETVYKQDRFFSLVSKRKAR